MLISILLSLALSSGTQPPAAQAPDPKAQAEQLARSGAYQAALEKFQALVAQNPDDLDLRVWIARLHDWMGEHDRAIAVYESITAAQPDHLDALVGLGNALVSVGRLHAAAAPLSRAEALAPQNATVLAAQGRLHANAGRTRLALAYYERALTLDPSAGGVRRDYDELRAEWAHRIEVGYVLEHFDTGGSDPQVGFGGINARVSDSIRVTGTVQHQRKFSRNETRGGGGIEWVARRNMRFHGGALFGGDAEVFPRVDGFGGVSYTYGRATWSFDLRIADFDQISVNVAGGGWRFALRRHAAIWVQYYRFDTDYPSARSDVVQSWVTGGSGRVARGWTVGAEYTRGPDQLYLLTLDRTGEFEADTFSGFTEVRFTPLLSLAGRYDYQTRPSAIDEDLRLHRATITLVKRF